MRHPVTRCALLAILALGSSRLSIPAAQEGAPASASALQAPVAQAQRAEFGVSLLAGFGAGTRVEDNDANRYGVGLGARAGFTLSKPHLYLGVSFLRFSGETSGGSTYRTSTLDSELGYDFRLLHEWLVLRPMLALGVAQVVTIQSDNAGYPVGFHFAPGLLVGLRWRPVTLSVEVRRDIVVQSAQATTLLLGVGLVL